ncbi:MAG: type II toxin-antitoxin system PemK/MazF family toxin [Clostridiaceae bacterium]|nr:type II toxin-antitoxin system PemK/MazF family toxin [Clostridiaceae bacterium]
MPINIDLAKTQMYLEWLKTKLFLDYNAHSARRRVVKRGEVYWCKLGQNIGSEECKERPCVVLQYDAGNVTSPNTIVAPITHSSSTLPVVIQISDKYDLAGNVILSGNVLLGNIVCVSKARLGDYITNLTPDEMKRVDEGIAISLDIKRHYDKLRNMYNDKLQYIEKLKSKISGLEEKLRKEETQFREFKDLLAEYGLNDIKELKTLIADKQNQKKL